MEENFFCPKRLNKKWAPPSLGEYRLGLNPATSELEPQLNGEDPSILDIYHRLEHVLEAELGDDISIIQPFMLEIKLAIEMTLGVVHPNEAEPVPSQKLSELLVQLEDLVEALSLKRG